MLKPTRTILTLAAGSLVLGLVGAGSAVADGATVTGIASQRTAAAADGWYAIGKVISKGPLKVRSKPTTHSRVVGLLQPHSKVVIKCKEYGQPVDGNHIWYRLHEEKHADEHNHGDWQNGRGMGVHGHGDKAYGQERWVAARYVENLTPVRYCR